MECIECKTTYSPDEIVYKCKRCGDLLEVKYDYSSLERIIDLKKWKNRRFFVWRYREVLPLKNYSNIVSILEGGTNLYRCKKIQKVLNSNEIFIKNEGENPTGSFKDRGMTVGVSKALELGMKKVVCASTGNTSASLAAYAAKAGLKCFVLIPSGKIALGKLAQAIAYGAKVIQIKGDFDLALKEVIKISELNPSIYLLNSINPHRIEGQKTLAYEVWEQLGYKAPDCVVVPVGNAGNISAIWKGFIELRNLNLIKELPRMVGIQAEGASPIAKAFKQNKNTIDSFPNPETLATAIRIGSPVSWKKALRAIKESNGLMETVTDQEIIDAQKLIARLEGIFVEPASASSIAGLKKLLEFGKIDKNEGVLCIATGHGLKDPDVVIKNYEKPYELESSKLIHELFN
ncbi:MAG: threonine synthase [Candidatus Bathyarchaeia archaeon]